ncbi:MAG: NAD(P)-dependent oxidoreductase [Methylobacteriaceae bacterium]|nr:NAD(P)-dependent oxidoreductase [Methylobacteriaceae bacterium]
MTGAVLVVGASGFVGRNLVDRFVARGMPVFAVVGRRGTVLPGTEATVALSDLASLPALPEDTVVVHLAAQRYDAGRFELAQSDIVTANTEIANAVFRFCLERGLKEVRMASSVAVYPGGLATLDDAVPVDLNAPPNRNEAFYAWSKRWAEITARLHHERFGISTISFRLSNPYGPHDSTDPRSAHVLPAFVMRALDDGPVFEIKGNPLVERDFIFIDDAVEAFWRSLALRGVQDEVNLCRGETTTLLDLARTILEVAGSDKRLQAGETETQGVLARRSTNGRLRRLFDDLAFTPLADGLRPTIDWYRDARG